jgi:uncharacterized protein YbjT (DUF2867 family)
MPENNLVLVTGATGYIAGALIPCLLESGYRVRCLVRDPSRLNGRQFSSHVEMIQGDVTNYSSLLRALEGVHTAFYLVHNMISGKHYHQRDIAGAANFAEAACLHGVEHIIYLGGLADPATQIGFHMRSRIQTGDVLRQGSVPVTEFRASLIIGSGSISFEMIRYLTEQIPLLAGPRWMQYLTQPIAVQNVVEFLISALENPACRGNIYEIGGPDVLTYADVIRIYARLRGLKRKVILLPIMPVWLMAFVVDRITPVRYPIAYPLIDGMRSDSIVKDHQAEIDFAQIYLLDYQTAVLTALDQLSPPHINRSWEVGSKTRSSYKTQGFFIECQQESVEASTAAVYQAFVSLGGQYGWLYLNPLWKLRGLLDRLLGGPGMRGRSKAETLAVGDLVDFYRVEELIPGHLLRLKAELKAPGAGWMEWHTKSDIKGRTLVSQTAFYAPKGVSGYLYWYLLLPFHRLVFAGLFEKLISMAREKYQSIGDKVYIRL